MGQTGRAVVTLYSLFPGKLIQITVQRKSQIKQRCPHVLHCRHTMTLVGRVAMMVGRKASTYRLQEGERHILTLACTDMDEVNCVPKAISDQGHSLKPGPIKLWRSFRHRLLQR